MRRLPQESAGRRRYLDITSSQVSGQFRPAPGQEPEMFVHCDVTGYALTGGA